MAFAVPKLEREESVKHCDKQGFELEELLFWRLEASVYESEESKYPSIFVIKRQTFRLNILLTVYFVCYIYWKSEKRLKLWSDLVLCHFDFCGRS